MIRGPILDRRAVVGGAVALPFLARSAGAQTPSPARGGTLRISVSQRVNTLNPLRHSNGPDYMAGELMYSGLTRLGWNMEALPDLATRWSSNAELTEWTFELRPNAFFRGRNRPVEPRDVVASYRAMLDPATASPARASLEVVQDIAEAGPSSVRLRLKYPYGDLPVALTHNDARILPAEIIDSGIQRAESEDIGTGPFKLVQYEPGRILRVARDERYFLPGRPYLDAIEQRIFPDTTAELAALINGESDVLSQLAETDFQQAEAAAGIATHRARSGRFYNIVMRCDQPPFNDLRVRRALQLSIDRAALIELVVQGFGREAADNPISSQYPYHRNIPPPERNIPEARRLLAEAGFPRGLRVVLHCANRPTARSALGIAVKEMAREAGIDIDVQTVAYDVYNATIWRRANFYVANWNMQPTADAMFALLFTSNAPWNDTQWNNARFDALVERARATTNAAAREQLYGEAQALLSAEIPYLIPFFQDVLSASRARVRNYRVHPRGGQYFLDEVWLG